MQWTQLPLGALEQAVKQAKGSGGADGWDGDEIQFLPKCAVKASMKSRFVGLQQVLS